MELAFCDFESQKGLGVNQCAWAFIVEIGANRQEAELLV